MESTRQQKIARLLQKDLSEIFLGYTKSRPGVIVSTTRVRVSPDLSVARVYLSVFPSSEAEATIQLVNDRQAAIRHDLAARTRYQLRTVPSLTFYLDDSLDYLERIDELLK